MSIRARIALALAGMLMPVLAVELGLRCFGPFLPGNYTIGTHLTYHPIFGSFHQPGAVGWEHTAEFVTRFEYNGKGLGGPEVEYTKPSGTVRVLVLGDSFVDASEVPRGMRFTDLLQARFDAQQRASRVEIINAGVSGWSNAQEMVYFEQEGYRFQPDLVLLMVYAHNDIQENTTRTDETDGSRDRPYLTLTEGRLQLLPFAAHIDSARERLDHLARQALLLYDILQTGVVRKQGQTSISGFERALPRVYLDESQPDMERAWDVTEALFSRLRDDVAGRGGRLEIVAVPSKWQVYREDWRAQLAVLHAQSRRWALTLPNQRLQRITETSGIPVLDPLPRFRAEAQRSSDRLYFPIDAHWTMAGHRLAAEALYEPLVAGLDH